MKDTAFIVACIASIFVGGFACGGQPSDPMSDGDTDTDDEAIQCADERLPLAGLRRLTRAELDGAIRMAFPSIAQSWGGVALGPDPMSPAGFSNDARELLVGVQTAEELHATAREVAALVTAEGTFSQWMPCVADSEPCRDEFITEVGRRLFRRDLTEVEKSRYSNLLGEIEATSDFVTAANHTLTAFLMSPHFVYRSEVGVPDGKDTHVLRPWEVAAALSFTFGGAGPSEELLARAEAGNLEDPDARVEVARELLQSPSGREIVHRFLREWIEYGMVETRTKDGIPDFTDIRLAMIAETKNFLDEAIFARDAGIGGLLTADYTVLDPQLADYYGYGTVQGPALVTRPEGWGVGLLAQGSILAGHAHGDSSSPTLRGRLVYERLFCGSVPPPPPQVPPIDPPEPGTRTTRERYEDVHAANDACRSCHRLMDPTGFTFEHFDATGRFRADEHGLPIDTAAEVAGPGGLSLSVNGLTDLAMQAAQRPEVAHCVATHMESYFFGGLSQGQCVDAEARQALVEADAGLLDFMASLAGTEAFVRRQAILSPSPASSGL